MPYPAGGPVDLLGRAIAPRLGEVLGQPVVVENRAGGSGTIGMDATIKAEPDGYTFGFGVPGGIAVLPHLQKLPYNVDEINYVSVVAKVPQVITVGPSVPVNSLPELIALAKRDPGKLNYGSTGSGSSNHLSMELFMSMTGTKMTHIPYKGSAPAVAALIGGDTDVLFDNIPNIIAQIKAGSVTPIAVTGSKPAAMLPGIPTVAESGVPGYEVNVWFGIQMPAGTPKPIVEKANRQLAEIFRTEEVTKRFNDQGVEVVASTPEEFQKLIASEAAKWAKVVKDAGVKIE